MIHIPLDHLGYQIHYEKIQERFSYPNPVYYSLKKRGYKKIDKDPIINNWDYTELDGIKHLSIPRGQMVWLKEYLNSNGIPFLVQDERAIGHQFKVEWHRDFNPYPYQKRGVDLLKKYQQGFWCYDPGAGKTVLGLLSIAELRTTTLILVNSNELAKQWRSRIGKFLVYSQSVGLIQQDTIDIKPITIALVQSLMGWETKDLAKLNDYFGFLIHDEAHHSPAQGTQKVLNCLSQKYRMALTASKTRKDELEFLGYDYYDKIRQVEKGNVLTPKVIQINTGSFMKWSKRMRWTKLETFLTKDEDRCQMIVDEALADVDQGHRLLILFNRNEAAKKIHKMLLSLGIRSRCLISGSKFELDVIEDQVVNGQIQVIVGCRIFDEGIDIPRLSCIYLCSPSSNKEGVRQRTGRVTRIFPSKPQPCIKDFIDNIIPCKRSAKIRLEWYREFGYEIPKAFMEKKVESLW